MGTLIRPASLPTTDDAGESSLPFYQRRAVVQTLLMAVGAVGSAALTGSLGVTPSAPIEPFCLVF
jgi:hypothetical protein